MHKLGRALDIKTKYKTSFLIDKLKEHRDNHIKDYAKAKEVYQEDLKSALKELYQKSLESMETFDLNSIKDSYAKVHNIVKPVDARKSYEQYISLLFNSADEIIELDISDANSIINDEWDWAITAKMTNSLYSNRG